MRGEGSGTHQLRTHKIKQHTHKNTTTCTCMKVGTTMSTDLGILGGTEDITERLDNSWVLVYHL